MSYENSDSNGSNLLHYNRLLANFGVKFQNEAYIADAICPVGMVSSRSDVYAVESAEQTRRSHGYNSTVGILEDAPEISFEKSSQTYTCVSHAISDKIPLDLLANADDELDLEMSMMGNLRNTLDLWRELRVRDLYQTTTNYPVANRLAVAAPDRWDTAGGGTPFKDIRSVLHNIERIPGGKVVCWMGESVWRVLIDNPQMLDRVKGGATTQAPASVKRQMLAAELEVDEVVVGKAWHVGGNPGNPGAQARVWGDFLGICAIPPMQTRNSMGFGRTFRFDQDEGAVEGFIAHEWIDPKKGVKGAKYFKLGHTETESIVASSAGAIISTPIN